MSRLNSFRTAVVCSTMLCIVGCTGPKMTLEDLKKMPMPPKPAELALLDPMVGTWQSTGEMTMAGIDQKIMGHGTQTISWENDGRTLVERMKWESPDMGACGTMTMMTLYTLEDAKEKEFKVVWASSMGDMTIGETKYNEKTKTWTTKGRGWDPMMKMNTQFKMSMTMPDPSTMEWTCEQWDAMGFTKMMTMKGTSKRR
ncbi:MAG: hypothetical protein HZA51_04260 [Planctomycetes bacterium]|nr:hypothetical protein [Planctomycetota bacterium]